MPTLRRDGDRLVVDAEPREQPALKQVPGVHWNGRRREFNARISWVTYAQLWAIFKDSLVVDPSVTPWLLQEAERQEQRRWLSRQLDLPPEWQWLTKGDRLYPPQKVGTEFLLLTRGAIIGDDMGGGKTPQICVGIAELLESHPGRRALVVAGKSSLEMVWAPHIREWVGVDPAVALGDVKKRRAAFESDSPVVLTSYDTLHQHSRLSPFGNLSYKRCPDCLRPQDPEPTVPVKPAQCEAHDKELNAIDWVVVAADEAHKIKDPTSKRTRALKALMWRAPWRWLATGTPQANHEVDFWSLLHAVQPHEWPSKSAFIERYLTTGWDGWGNLTLLGLNQFTSEEFHALTDSIMIRRPKEVLMPWLPKALPPEVRIVELPRGLRATYNEVRDDLIAQVDGGLILAPNPLTNATRLRQLACSAIEQVDEHTWRMVEPSPKLDELEEVLEELGPNEPVVVFAEYRGLIELAEERLAKKRVTYSSFHGGQLDVENESAMRRWQAGETQVLLMTLAKGAESFTLTRAHIIVYIQESFSYLQMQQSRDRIDRDGQTLPPLHIYIRSAGTIETKVAAAQADKGERFEELVQDRQRFKELL